MSDEKSHFPFWYFESVSVHFLRPYLAYLSLKKIQQIHIFILYFLLEKVFYGSVGQ